MIRAPQLERRRRQDDACLTRCWSVDTGGQARGRINFASFQHGVKVAGMLSEMPEHASPNAGTAS